MNGLMRRQEAARRLEQSGPMIWQFTAAAGGFGLAGAGVFGGLHPLALGLVLGTAGPYVMMCAAGACVGYLFLLPVAESIRYIAASAAALAGRCLFQNIFAPGAVGGCGVLLSVQLMLSVSGLSSPAQAVAALGDALLAAGYGWALTKAGRLKRFQLGPVDAPGLLVGLGLLPALCALPTGPLQPAVWVLGAAGLVLAYRGRVRECGAVCVAGAVVIAAARPELSFAGLSLAAGCLAAAWAVPGERTGSGAVFLAVCVFGSLAAPDSVLALGFLASAVLAELLFFALPRHWMAALPGRAEGETEDAQRPRRAGTASRLEQVADALTGIAETVDQVYQNLPKKGESYNWVADHVAEELCRSCPRRESCWVEDYSTTMDGFFRMKPILEEQGRAAVEQLPGQFCRCIHPVELCGAASRAYTLYRSRRESRVKAGAMRAAVTEQYTAMAQALSNMAERLGQSLAPDEGKCARISALFASIGLEPLEIQVGYEVSGRLRAQITVSRTAFTKEELAELRCEIRQICRRPLGAFELSHSGAVSILTITEQAVFVPVFGQVSHAARPGACGDATRQFCDSFGCAHLMLCDGMGIGRPAAIDGAMAANLGERLLKAGFTASSAARLVNVALALKSDEESGATLDLVTVDLFTGRARLFKAGACPTFLVREGRSEEIEGSSLPVGILDGVVGKQDIATLTEGDMAVLVSDGALCDGSVWLRQQLELCAAVGSTPQEIAQILADTALERAKSRGRPDDITVAVLRLDKVG